MKTSKLKYDIQALKLKQEYERKTLEMKQDLEHKQLVDTCTHKYDDGSSATTWNGTQGLWIRIL